MKSFILGSVMEKKDLSNIRRDYGCFVLSKETSADSPYAQFEDWFQDVLKTEVSDPTAMTLATVDEHGHPDARIVLLKGIENGAFIFYTNYQSEKAIQIEKMPYAALNFYWPQMARQVRVRGEIKKVSQRQSDAYFASRPLKSQLSAIISPQSCVVSSRQVLEDELKQLIAHSVQQPVVRPDYWGGYQVIPFEMEFWQGRDNRLHDRIHYQRKENEWIKCRLAP